MTMRPDTGALYVGDVGWNVSEEIDVVTPGANFGWPCYEGSGETPDLTEPDFRDEQVCQDLYDAVAADTAHVVAPLWSYPHDDVSAAVTGGVFVTGTNYPAEYRDAYFFADFSRAEMWALADRRATSSS